MTARDRKSRQGIEDASRPLRVLLADDDPMVRRLIREVLREAGITVVAEAENGRDAVALTRFYHPDVALLDVIMPGMDGLTALERIVADERVDTHVVMLSVRGEHDIAIAALRKGAVGYMNKDVDLRSLPEALLGAWNGDAILSPRLAAELIARMRELPEAGVGMRPIESPLSPREWQVADLLCQQRTTSEIADELVVAVETVRTHTKKIMRKLEVHSRADAVREIERLRSGLENSHGRRP